MTKPKESNQSSHAYQFRMKPGLKRQWDDLCQRQNKKSAPYLRELMWKIVREEIPDSAIRQIDHQCYDDEAKKRVSVRFTPSEIKAVREIAAIEGTSTQRWIHQAVRPSLGHDPEITLAAIKELNESTERLRDIGRIINGIAKQMNEDSKAGKPLSPPTKDQLSALSEIVEGHFGKVEKVQMISLNRWLFSDDKARG